MAMQVATAPNGSMRRLNVNQVVLNVTTEKEPIPVVPHKFTDEDVGLFDGDVIQHLNLGKIVSLMVDPLTGSYMDRHIFLLKKLLKITKHGFLLKDLLHVASILEFLFSKMEHSSEVLGTIRDIIDRLAFPCLTQNTSDEVTYHVLAVDAFNRIGELMKVDHLPTRIQLLRTFITFYVAERKPAAVHKHRSISPAGSQAIIDDSGIAEQTVQVLALTDAQNSDEEAMARAVALDLLERLSRRSRKNCEHILKVKGALRVCNDMFEMFQHGCDNLFVISNLLWNLLENASKLVVPQLSDLQCISQIKDAFVYQLTQGYSHYDRQLRNDLLVISTLIASENPLAPFIETGFAKLLVLFATYPETKSHNPLVKNFKLAPNHEDFELKKLLFNFLVVSSRDPTMILILQEQHALLALLEYVRPNDTDKRGKKIPKLKDEPNEYAGSGSKATSSAGSELQRPTDQNPAAALWPPAYFEELQLHSIACLAELAPKLISEYLLFNGGTRILLLLDWCVGSIDYGGHGNSFFGVGGRGNKRAQMRLCLRLIRALISSGNEAVAYDLCDQGLIPQLTSILLKCAQAGSKTTDHVDVEIQCDMMFILSTICDADIHRKELFGSTGIEALLALLETNPKSLQNGDDFMQLLQHTVEAIWSCVVGCPTNEDHFVERGGVFMLLDLLQMVLYDRDHFVSRVGNNGKRQEVDCNPLVVKQAVQLSDFNLPIVNAILGCLIDLSEAIKPVAHIKTWTYTPTNEAVVVRSAGAHRSGMHHDDARNGPPQRSTVHLLCELWRVEEIRLMVSRHPETGEITNVVDPLAARNVLPAAKRKCATISSSLNDIHANLRGKIYSLFCKLGFDDIPANGITTEDNVTLCVIEKYLDFKTAEIWREIQRELEDESVRPITPDAEAIDIINRSALDNAHAIATIQRGILEAQQQIDTQNEQKYYAELRETHHQKQRQIDQFKAFVERTSRHEMLKAAKAKQLQLIDASRIETKYKDLENFHAVEMRNLHTTVFCHKQVAVDSTPKEMLLVSKYQGEAIENRMMLEWTRDPPIIDYESDVEDENEDPEYVVGRQEHDLNMQSSRSKPSNSASHSISHSQPISTLGTTVTGTEKTVAFKEEQEVDDEEEVDADADVDAETEAYGGY